MRKLLLTFGLVVALCVPVLAQSSPIAVDVFGSFGRGFAAGEKISYNYGIRPIYDVGVPVSFGTELTDGPTTPTEWSFVLASPPITIKFGKDTSTLGISIKAATVLNDGTQLKDDWVALTLDYKPNKIKGGVWNHLSIMTEPALRLIDHKPNYFFVRSGLRYSF